MINPEEFRQYERTLLKLIKNTNTKGVDIGYLF